MISVLPASMNLNQPGNRLAASGRVLRKPIDRSEPGFPIFEDPDPKANDPQHDVIFFPFSERFCFEWFRTRIEPGPHLLKVLRCLHVVEQRQRFTPRIGGMKRSDCSEIYGNNGDVS